MTSRFRVIADHIRTLSSRLRWHPAGNTIEITSCAASFAARAYGRTLVFTEPFFYNSSASSSRPWGCFPEIREKQRHVEKSFVERRKPLTDASRGDGDFESALVEIARIRDFLDRSPVVWEIEINSSPFPMRFRFAGRLECVGGFHF